MTAGERYVVSIAQAMPSDALRREVLKALSKDAQELERLSRYRGPI
jgi:hypothetical protein